ncbi:MAG: rhamnogalacturonan acetylesterase [Ferruginibacter sp.]
MKRIKLWLVLLVLATMAFTVDKHKPVLYIIGDSTVKNGDGKNSNLLQGWGSFIDAFFDTSKISIQNDAIGGRSSRTFLTDGRWDKIIATLQKGDFVIMQFGHNDGGALDDTARARGTIKGIGEDSIEIYNPIRKQQELVHTYGWYLRKYVNEAKQKGAIPIVCSPIPRNDWKDGKVLRSNDGYALWSKQVATQTGAYFIDLNNIIADDFEKIGQQKTNNFFPQEHTHTNKEGAIFNAKIVVAGIQLLQHCTLKEYLLK